MAQNGLTGNYYNNPTRTGTPVLTRIDESINFDWNAPWNPGQPPPPVNPTDFSVRWTGQLKAPVAGTYTFSTNADDAASLWINNQLVLVDILWERKEGEGPRQGSIDLMQNQVYDLVLDYMQATGSGRIYLSWAYPGQAQQIIPSTALFPSTATGIPTLPTLNGPVYCWGANGSGQLGDGTTTNRNSPVQVQGLPKVGINALAPGGWHSLVLLEDGTVQAWGANDWGQLGNGTKQQSSQPVKVSDPSQNGVPLSGIKAIAAGGWPNMGLLADGTVWAWGANDWGQLGDGTQVTPSKPVKVLDLAGVKAIAVGGWHCLTVLADGTVWTWGANNYGQIGDGTTIGSAIPNTRRKVVKLTQAKALAGGGQHSLALLEDGTVWAWGLNDYYQLGDGTNTSRNIPVRVQNLTNVKAIAASWRTSLALLADGTVWAWGYNGEGQLGDGTNTSRNSPVQVKGLTAVKAIATSPERHNIACC